MDGVFMTYKELKLSRNYEELSRYYYVFNMLSSEVFRLIKKEVQPLEIFEDNLFYILLPRSLKDYRKGIDKTLIRCRFKYRGVDEVQLQTNEIPLRNVEEFKWKNCDDLILDFSFDFYEKVEIKERVDEKNKIVDYLLELKEKNELGDLRRKRVMKQQENCIDFDDIAFNKEVCQSMVNEITSGL